LDALQSLYQLVREAGQDTVAEVKARQDGGDDESLCCRESEKFSDFSYKVNLVVGALTHGRDVHLEVQMTIKGDSQDFHRN